MGHARPRGQGWSCASEGRCGIRIVDRLYLELAMTLISSRSPWHDALSAYTQPRTRRGLLDIATSAGATWRCAWRCT